MLNWARRFIGYRAIEHGYNQEAYQLFYRGDTTTSNQRDIMAAAWALLLDDQIEQAKDTLRIGMLIQWNYLTPSDLLAMHNLLQLVNAEDEPDAEFKAFQENLIGELNNIFPSGNFPPLDMQLFCGVYE